MDNRITKSRLSNFLAYEWIAIIALCVGAVILFEMIFSVSAVRLTVGQEFKFFYDYNIVYSDNYYNLMTELQIQEDMGYSNGKTFSYEIQKIDVENLMSDNDVFQYRIAIQEGDIFITDDAVRNKKTNDVEYEYTQAKTRIDNFREFMSYDKMLVDAKAYLSGLLKDGETAITADNLDSAKIKNGFEKRLGGDNRFRSKEQIEQGLALETERVQRLCKEVSDFEKLLNLGNEYFFTYTKYTQSKSVAEKQGQNVAEYDRLIQIEKDANRENAKYGLRIDKINQIKVNNEGKVDASKYFSRTDLVGQENETDLTKDIVILLMDYLSYQPELQFESITVVNNIVRSISTVLD